MIIFIGKKVDSMVMENIVFLGKFFKLEFFVIKDVFYVFYDFKGFIKFKMLIFDYVYYLNEILLLIG